MHGVLHALPLTYNKDLQEDKEHLFDAADTLALTLAAAHGMVAGARFDRKRMAAAASDELIAATDLADLLVRRGIPFREAHGTVAALVREAVTTGTTLRDVAVRALGRDAAEVLERSSWLESKVSEGGTALARVREQLDQARAVLD
jgi:argininosuccinate lyase